MGERDDGVWKGRRQGLKGMKGAPPCEPWVLNRGTSGLSCLDGIWENWFIKERINHTASRQPLTAAGRVLETWWVVAFSICMNSSHWPGWLGEMAQGAWGLETGYRVVWYVQVLASGDP